jgi:PhnB protein
MDRPRVAPYLTITPAAAGIAFYTNVFGAHQKAFVPSLDGMRIMHCELEINGGTLMLADAFPELTFTRPPVQGEPVTSSVSLEYDKSQEVDDIFARATALGAKSETAPTNSLWRTRFAVFRDPFGHRWILNAPL